jgi:hypothetical protein
MTRSGWWLTAALIISALEIHAAQTSRQTLQDAKSVTCEFKLMTTGTWARDGVASGEAKPASLTIAFTDVDTQEGAAEVAGTQGAPHIIVQYSGGYLHFMQVGSVGFLHTTTVFDKVNRPGRYKAVHTRHEYTEVALPGYTSRPQQYFGDCEVRP